MGNKKDKQEKNKKPGELRLCFGLLIHSTNNNQNTCFGINLFVTFFNVLFIIKKYKKIDFPNIVLDKVILKQIQSY